MLRADRPDEGVMLVGRQFDDLATLAALRNELPDDRCPKTLAFADSHGLWPGRD